MFVWQKLCSHCHMSMLFITEPYSLFLSSGHVCYPRHRCNLAKRLQILPSLNLLFQRFCVHIARSRTVPSRAWVRLGRARVGPGRAGSGRVGHKSSTGRAGSGWVGPGRAQVGHGSGWVGLGRAGSGMGRTWFFFCVSGIFNPIATPDPLYGMVLAYQLHVGNNLRKYGVICFFSWIKRQYTTICSKSFKNKIWSAFVIF